MIDFSIYIPTIEKKIGYVFRDKSLLRQAFTRASFCNEANRRTKTEYQSNEVLEFFGDSALSLAIVTSFIKQKTERYQNGIKSDLGEGDFSNIRSKLADKKNLSEAVSKLGLEKYFILGEGDAKLDIASERSVKEDLFESIIGAIYIDSEMNIDIVISSVELMLDVSEYLKAPTASLGSVKNRLQEWCASKNVKKSPPVYKKISESGPDHKKVYRCACYIDGELFGEGDGRSVKAAECAAADEAMKRILGT